MLCLTSDNWGIITFFSCVNTGSVVAMTLMDKLGRKLLLMGSFTGMVYIFTPRLAV